MKEKLIVLIGDKKKVRNLCIEASKVPQMFYVIKQEKLLDELNYIRTNLVTNISMKFFKKNEEVLKNKYEIVIMDKISGNIEKAVMRLLQEFYIIPQNRGKLMIHVIKEGEIK